eukprot:scaffold13021_cov22-Tisochrysis_lutea.AAC.1
MHTRMPARSHLRACKHVPERASSNEATFAHAGEGGNEQEQELQAKAWAAVPPPSPAPFKAQFVLHSVKDMASLGSNSTQPTTLGWLWSQAAAAAAVGARLTERRAVPSAANAAAESSCEEVPTPTPTPTPPPNTAMQPTSAMQLPAMLSAPTIWVKGAHKNRSAIPC